MCVNESCHISVLADGERTHLGAVGDGRIGKSRGTIAQQHEYYQHYAAERIIAMSQLMNHLQ